MVAEYARSAYMQLTPAWNHRGLTGPVWLQGWQAPLACHAQQAWPTLSSTSDKSHVCRSQGELDQESPLPMPGRAGPAKRVQPGVFGLPASSAPKMPGQAHRPEGQSGAPHMQAAGLEVRSVGTVLV